MCKKTILIVFQFACLSVFSQVEAGKKNVETLCSEAFHGRGYVNSGDSLAAEYIANQFKEIGCSFFKNTPFQPFEFTVNTFPDSMSLQINGTYLTAGKDFVVTPESNSAVILNAQPIYLTKEDFLEPKRIKNKLSERFSNNKEGKSTKILLIADFGDLKKDSLAAGKKQLLDLNQMYPVIEIVDTKFTWSVAQERNKEVYLMVQKSAIPEGDLQISIRVKSRIIEHNARNVIAFVPSKKRSKKYLVLTAHYDHLGQMGDKCYFPGANDNASGTALLIEMARYYQANPLKKTNVVFMSFAGEEVGLLGSEHYTKNPIFPLSKIKFLFNIDIMGSGEEGATVVNATVFPEQFKVLEKVNADKNLLVKIGQRGKAANSDHYFFTEKGVPSFFLYTMGPNKHYHDVDDTYANLSFAEFNDLFLLLQGFFSAL